MINTKTGATTATVPVGTVPYSVALNPTGTTAYVTNLADGTVSVINTSSNTVTKTITVGAAPAGVTVAPGGQTVYVTNALDGTVSVINAATDTVTGRGVMVNSPLR